MDDNSMKLPENKTEGTSDNGTDIQQPDNQPKIFGSHGDVTGKHKKKGRFSWIRFDHKDFTKKQWAIYISVIVFLLAGGTAAAYYLYKHFSKTPPYVQLKYEKPKPTKLPSPLTGVIVPIADTTRPVTGVMIENSPDARPQAGLNDAGVVYEAIAEGGITRFLALYQESKPSYIGPVRSARPYYLDFVLPFKASLAHVGGSPDALRTIRSLHVRDLDQFYNSSAYWRVSSRYAPHNVYTAMDKLNALEAKKGFKYEKFDVFSRKRRDTPSQKPTATKIDLNISSYYYNVHYDYSTKYNYYLRTEGGTPHKDDKSKQQLHPRVVIALVMPYGLASDGYHSNYKTSGTGQMLVFQDGTVTPGTWSKASHQAQFVFKDAKGNAMKLNPGQTWVTLLGSRSQISYKP